MCLYVDTKFHPGRTKSRRATQDILVYKVLKVGTKYDIRGNSRVTYEAPYQGTAWKLGEKVTATVKVYDRNTFYPSVEEGLHSCLNMESARSRTIWADSQVFPAVIPKGSIVYFGENDEAASNALIVYKSRAALIKARGAIGPGIARAKIAI